MKQQWAFLAILLAFIALLLFFSANKLTGMFVSVTKNNLTLSAWSDAENAITFFGTEVAIYANLTNSSGSTVLSNCSIFVNNKTFPMEYNSSLKLYTAKVPLLKGNNSYNVSCNNIWVSLYLTGYDFEFFDNLTNAKYLRKKSELLNISNGIIKPNLNYTFDRKMFSIEVTNPDKTQKIIIPLSQSFTRDNCSHLLITLRNSTSEVKATRYIQSCGSNTSILFSSSTSGNFTLIAYDSNYTINNNKTQFLKLSKQKEITESYNEKIYAVKWINDTSFVVAGGDYLNGDYKWRIEMFDSSGNRKWSFVYDHETSGGDEELPFDIAVTPNDIIVVGFDRELNTEINFQYFRWIVLDLDMSGNLKWKYNYTSTEYVQSDKAKSVAVDSRNNIYVLGKIGNPSGWKVVVLNSSGYFVRSFSTSCGSRNYNFPYSILVLNNTVYAAGRCDSGTPTGWLRVYNSTNGENLFSLNLSVRIPYDLKFYKGFLWDIAYDENLGKLVLEKRSLNGTLVKEKVTDLEGSDTSENREASLAISSDGLIYVAGHKNNPSSGVQNYALEIYDENLNLIDEFYASDYTESEAFSVDTRKDILLGGYKGSDWLIGIFSPFDFVKIQAQPIEYISLISKKIGGKIGNWIKFSSNASTRFPIKIIGNSKNYTIYSNETLDLLNLNNTWIEMEFLLPSNFSETKLSYEIAASKPYQIFLGNSTVTANGRVFASTTHQLPVIIVPNNTITVETKYFNESSLNVSELILKGNASLQLFINFSKPVKYVLFVNNTIFDYNISNYIETPIELNGTVKVQVKRDLSSPFVSLELSKNTINIGDSVIVNCSYGDDVAIRNVTLFVEKDGEKKPFVCNSTFKPNSTGTYVFVINASDYFSWTNVSKILSVLEKRQSKSSSSSSSHSFSGDGVSVPSSTPTFSSQQQNINKTNETETQKNQTKPITVEVTYIDLRGIRLISIGAPIKVKKVYETSEDIETFVTKTLPALLSRIKIYKTLEIETPKEPKKAYIYFNVSKNWLRKNGIDKKDVAAYEVKNSSVKKLKTEIIGETENVVEYRAVTTGFSYIVIGAEKSSCVESTHICVNNSLFVCKNGKFVLEKTCSFGCNNSTGTCIEKTSNRKSYYYYLSILALIPLIFYVFVKKKSETKHVPKKKRKRR